MIINFFRNFGLTKRESILVLFLLFFFIVGIIAPFIFSTGIPNFDYSRSDLQFEKSISDAFNGLNNSQTDYFNPEKFEKFISVKDTLESYFDNQKEKKSSDIIKNKININLAYEKDFEQLPGIGPVIAERIVNFREKINKFKNINEIMDVKGIGQKKFDKIKNYLTID